MNYLKVALATPKVYLGNPQKNVQEITKIIKHYEKADIVVFPELSITGYSIGDWVFNKELLENAKKALQQLVNYSSSQVIIVGAPLEIVGAIYNCAVVIQNKKILGIVPKINLPDGGEFYEKRFFTSGMKFSQQTIFIHLFGEQVRFGSQIFYNCLTDIYFGVEICGDMFGQSNPHQYLYRPLDDFVDGCLHSFFPDLCVPGMLCRCLYFSVHFSSDLFSHPEAPCAPSLPEKYGKLFSGNISLHPDRDRNY